MVVTAEMQKAWDALPPEEKGRIEVEECPLGGWDNPPWAAPPPPFVDPNGEAADDDDRERHYAYSKDEDGKPKPIGCQARFWQVLKPLAWFTDLWCKITGARCRPSRPKYIVFMWHVVRSQSSPQSFGC